MNSLLRGNALFALAAAVLWGGGDFSGGMGVNSAGGGVRGALRVVLLSHITSFAVLVAIARARGDVFPQGALLAWGIVAGVAGGLALVCFYLALSRGAMGASAAVSGLLAAAIPAALTLWQEGSPGAVPLAGFVVAGAAIWLIAASPEESSKAGRGTMALAMLAGVGFGFYFVALKMAGPAGVIWPMATARVGSLSVCGLMLLERSQGFHALGKGLQGGFFLRKKPLRGEASASSYPEFARGHTLRPWKAAEAPAKFGARAVGWSLATALLDTSGNLLFLAATRAGRLDVAAVLASLYPASTILLAALALGERPTRRQALGMMTAVVAVVLIAV